jgi:hypothetical protein
MSVGEKLGNSKIMYSLFVIRSFLGKNNIATFANQNIIFIYYIIAE